VAGRIPVVGGTAGRAEPGLPSVGVTDCPYADAVARIATPAMRASDVFRIFGSSFKPAQRQSVERVAAPDAFGHLIGTADRFVRCEGLRTPTPQSSPPTGFAAKPRHYETGAFFVH
jgi:hypothetical protein